MVREKRKRNEPERLGNMVPAPDFEAAGRKKRKAVADTPSSTTSPLRTSAVKNPPALTGGGG